MTAPVLYVLSRWGEPTETFVRREVDAVRAAGCQVVVLSLKLPIVGPRDPEVIHLRPWMCIVSAMITTIRHPVRAGRAVARILRLSRPATVLPHLAGALHGLAAARTVGDVCFVHAHFAWVSATAADVLATCRGVSYGVMPHAFDIYVNRIVDRYLRDKLRRARLVVVESDRIASDVREMYGVKAYTLRIGVPRTYTHVPERDERADRVRLVSVGSLVPKKGHGDLLRAVANLPVELTLVGGGPEEVALRELAASLGISDRVVFTGALSPEEVMNVLDRHDIFVLASRVDRSGDRDGVPNVLIEAMARRLPVVATDLGGVADLVGGVGAVVPPGKPEAVGSAIRRWIDHPHERRAAGDAGYQKVCTHYVAEDNAAWLVDHFAQHARG